MLIPVNEPVLRFDYTRVNTFSVDWPFYGLGSIQVKATDKASVDPIVAQLVYGIDYSVSGVLASAQDSPQAYIRGSVTLLPPGTAKIPAVDPVIVIYRATDPEQQYQYAELDNFPALSHENALGQAIVLIQEILEELDRCIKAPLGANLTGDQYITELLEAIEQIADISGQLAEIRALAAQAAASASQAATYAGAKNQPGGVVGIEPNGDIDLTPLGASGKGRISCGPSVSAFAYGGQYSAVFRTNKARGTKEAPEPPIAGDQAAAFNGYVYASTGWVQAMGILGYVTAANPSGVPLCSTRFYVGDGGGAALSLEVTPTVVEAGFDNKSSLGLGSRRWTTVYAATGAINTSDERIKSIVELPTKDYDALMASWGATVAPVLYKLNDSIEEKGFDRARTHMGFVAQRVAKAFSDAGLDAGGYGLWCHDRWDAQSEIKDKEDNITQAYRAAGDLYSLRYEECLVMEAAYQRWRADKIEDRLTVLETKMEVMANG